MNLFMCNFEINENTRQCQKNEYNKHFLATTEIYEKDTFINFLKQQHFDVIIILFSKGMKVIFNVTYFYFLFFLTYILARQYDYRRHLKELYK